MRSGRRAHSPRRSRAGVCAAGRGACGRGRCAGRAIVTPIPDAMDFVTAAAFPVAYGTPHFALTHRGHLAAGETLLVLGAAGGVGLAAIEVGKLLGARVFAAASTAEKLAI